ncbi:unnamed protein product [Cladocopium goreaui]|uniref:Uncharacterized protein n=1 Tax=Cladocopium goreaui TaxID=2562237 RepID=A0A9P1DFE7_9DINO|nr:unnamed protein product [Cladocopium goreaui]
MSDQFRDSVKSEARRLLQLTGPGLDDAPRTPPERARSCWQSPEGPQFNLWSVEPEVAQVSNSDSNPGDTKQTDDSEIVRSSTSEMAEESEMMPAADAKMMSQPADLPQCEAAREPESVDEKLKPGGKPELESEKLDAVEQKPGESLQAATETEISKLPGTAAAAAATANAACRSKSSETFLATSDDEAGPKTEPLPIKRPAAKDEIQGAPTSSGPAPLTPLKRPAAANSADDSAPAVADSDSAPPAKKPKVNQQKFTPELYAWEEKSSGDQTWKESVHGDWKVEEYVRTTGKQQGDKWRLFKHTSGKVEKSFRAAVKAGFVQCISADVD